MSLAAFQSNPNVSKSPLEEIETSENVNATIRNMLSPERIDSLFKSRPCLVFDIYDDSKKYTLLAVTHFGGKSIVEAKMVPERKKYALPIAPNTVDIEGRRPLQTDPAWPDDYSYQVLIPNEAHIHEVHPRVGRRIIMPENQLH